MQARSEFVTFLFLFKFSKSLFLLQGVNLNVSFLVQKGSQLFLRIHLLKHDAFAAYAVNQSHHISTTQTRVTKILQQVTMNFLKKKNNFHSVQSENHTLMTANSDLRT